MMQNIFKLLMMSGMSLAVIGCGSETSLQSDVTVHATKSTLSANKKQLTMDLKLTNNYASNVKVEMKDLAVNVSPCILEHGSVTPNSIAFENKRTVAVTAKLSFQEKCVPTAYNVEGTSVITLDGKTKEIPLSSSVKDLNATQVTPIGNGGGSDANNSSADIDGSSDTINYRIKFSLEEQSVMKFNLEEKKSIEISLIDPDTGSSVSDEKIISLKVISKQKNLLKLFDANENTTPSGLLSYEKINNLIIYAQTYTRSGLADIDVEIEYLNRNDHKEKISKTYSIIIQSGAPTAFSINSAGVSYNFETKWFEHKYMISAVDRYNNIVNISPTIYVSAISGLAKESSGKEILYGKFGDVKGTLNPEDGTFKATKAVFNNIDLSRDTLFVFGDVKQYEALGKWDIDPYGNSADTLKLAEVFNGTAKSGLGFLVGHNYLDDVASSSSKEWQVKIDSTDGSYQLDEEGKAFVTLKYPPYFIGKRIAFAVNFLGKTPESEKILRSGEVEIMTARNLNGVKTPEAITIDANSSMSITVPFEIDTGTEDRFFVRNSHVRCDVEYKNIIRPDQIIENKIYKSVEDYRDHGLQEREKGLDDVAYWVLNLHLINEGESGTLTFKECNVKTLSTF